jgi:hypothetical protein
MSHQGSAYRDCMANLLHDPFCPSMMEFALVRRIKPGLGPLSAAQIGPGRSTCPNLQRQLVEQECSSQKRSASTLLSPGA